MKVELQLQNPKTNSNLKPKLNPETNPNPNPKTKPNLKPKPSPGQDDCELQTMDQSH